MRQSPKIGFRCDASPHTGVGHLMRCIALGEEFAARGFEVVFLSSLGGLSWAERQLASRKFAIVDAPSTIDEFVERACAMSLSAVVLDSYDLPQKTGQALRGAGIGTIVIHDGDTRGQVADIYIDQNLGAEELHHPLPQDARSLAGLDYVLLRDDVRRYRPHGVQTADPDRIPRLLCFFGGTDPFRAAPVIGRLLVDSAKPFRATFIAATPSIAVEIEAIEFQDEQQVETRAPTDHLPRLAANADLVISASGTSTWELLCLGVPAALVWVADNQQSGYERVISAGLAEGLGHLSDLTSEGRQHAIDTLTKLLGDTALRHELSRRGWVKVDGKGRERAVHAVTELIATRTRSCQELWIGNL